MTLNYLLKNPYIRILLASLWTLFLTIYLLQPENQPVIPQPIPTAPPSFQREVLFTSLHLITFGFTAWLWCFALAKTALNESLWLVAIVLLGYGLSIEFIQSNIPGRNTQVWDMVANGVGILTGIGVWIRYFRHGI